MKGGGSNVPGVRHGNDCGVQEVGRGLTPALHPRVMTIRGSTNLPVEELVGHATLAED